MKTDPTSAGTCLSHRASHDKSDRLSLLGTRDHLTPRLLNRSRLALALESAQPEAHDRAETTGYAATALVLGVSLARAG
jgi:hypothetical protein